MSAHPSRRATTEGAPRRGRGLPFVQEYLLFTLNRRKLAFPLVHIRLRGRRGTLRTVALADSGATSSFVPVEIAREVGLHLVPGPTAGGGGGDFPTYDGHLTVELLHGRKVVHTFRRLPVSVPRDPGRIPYVVLGRDSLFRAFTVTFDERASRLLLRPARS